VASNCGWSETQQQHSTATKRTKNSRINEPVEFSKKYSKMRSTAKTVAGVELDNNTATRH
jgi:hypothetical protein